MWSRISGRTCGPDSRKAEPIERHRPSVGKARPTIDSKSCSSLDENGAAESPQRRLSGVIGTGARGLWGHDTWSPSLSGPTRRPSVCRRLQRGSEGDVAGDHIADIDHDRLLRITLGVEPGERLGLGLLELRDPVDEGDDLPGVPLDR
jgi:hypothetical protein